MEFFKSLRNFRICSLMLGCFVAGFTEVSLNAQPEPVSISMMEGALIRNVAKQGNKGFAVQVKKKQQYGTTKTLYNKVVFYDKDLIKKWEYQVPLEEKMDEEFLVANEKTDYVYLMNPYYEGNGEAMYNTVLAYRIDMKGKAEKLKLKLPVSDAKASVFHVFSDKDKLYYLSYKPAEYKGNKIIKPEALHLFTLGHNETKFSSTKVGITFDKDGQLSFLGVKDSVFFVAHKRIDMETNKLEAEVYTVGTDGVVTGSFKIEPAITGYYSPWNFAADCEFSGDYDNTKCFNIGYETGGLVIHLPNCLFNIFYDKKFDRFCAYGMITDDNTQQATMSDATKSILFQTYSLSGVKQSTTTISVDNHEANGPFLNRKFQGYLKTLNVSVVAENVFRFDFHNYLGDVTTFYIDKKKILSGLKTDKFMKVMDDFSDRCELRDEMKIALIANTAYAPKQFVSYVQNEAKNTKTDLSALELGDRMVLFKVIRGKSGDELQLELFQ